VKSGLGEIGMVWKALRAGCKFEFGARLSSHKGILERLGKFGQVLHRLLPSPGRIGRHLTATLKT